MLTNTYEYLAIILRSLRLVANCTRKPIRHIFATIWRICREYICLHSQGYSPQCESSITRWIPWVHVKPHFLNIPFSKMRTPHKDEKLLTERIQVLERLTKYRGDIYTTIGELLPIRNLCATAFFVLLSFVVYENK